MLDAKFFRKIGPRVRDRYRNHIFKNALDVFGKKFKGYKEPYKTKKRSGKLKRQATQYANTTAPVLTSDLLRDYSLIQTRANGFQIGWTTLGARVEWLKKMGRVLTTSAKALPDSVAIYLQEQVKIEIDKKLGGNTTTVHKIKK
jgi:hypothetical protein